ncbi:MAG: TraR/DksA family transcriptional regulator [Cognaticolwellia sp.]
MKNEILDNLRDKKTELQRRIGAIEADYRQGRSQDFSEQTSENENNEVLNEIHHEAKLELALINQAIVRVDNNEYGICSQCAKTINPERLRVLPYIDTCIDCAK